MLIQKQILQWKINFAEIWFRWVCRLSGEPLRKLSVKTRYALEGPIMWWLDLAVFSSNMSYFRKRRVSCEVNETTNKVFFLKKNRFRCIVKFCGHDASSCLMPRIVLVHFVSSWKHKRHMQIDWTKYRRAIYKIRVRCIFYHNYKNRKSDRPSVLGLTRLGIRLNILFLRRCLKETFCIKSYETGNKV